MGATPPSGFGGPIPGLPTLPSADPRDTMTEGSNGEVTMVQYLANGNVVTTLTKPSGCKKITTLLPSGEKQIRNISGTTGEITMEWIPAPAIPPSNVADPPVNLGISGSDDGKMSAVTSSKVDIESTKTVVSGSSHKMSNKTLTDVSDYKPKEEVGDIETIKTVVSGSDTP